MLTQTTHSSRPVYRLAFPPATDMAAVEHSLSLAILAVSCLHGEPAVRLEAGYAIDAAKRTVVLEGGGPLATAVARVFVGLCAQEEKTSAFKVARTGGPTLMEVGPSA